MLREGHPEAKCSNNQVDCCCCGEYGHQNAHCPLSDIPCAFCTSVRVRISDFLKANQIMAYIVWAGQDPYHYQTTQVRRWQHWQCGGVAYPLRILLSDMTEECADTLLSQVWGHLLSAMPNALMSDRLTRSAGRCHSHHTTLNQLIY